MGARELRSIRFARLGWRRLLANRLGRRGRVGSWEGIVDFLVQQSLFGLLRGVSGAAHWSIGIPATLLHLSLVHRRLLADRQKNASFKLKFRSGGTEYRLRITAARRNERLLAR
jgi:hypothetical protein